MTNDTITAISTAELKEWRARIAGAFNPLVEFDSDPKIMLQRAYDARGDVLSYLNTRLCALHIPLPDGRSNTE